MIKRSAFLICLVLGCASTKSAVEPAQTGEMTHVVAYGETLFSLSKKYGVPLETLARRNQIDDPSLLQTGQILIIPSESPPADSVHAREDASILEPFLERPGTEESFEESGAPSSSPERGKTEFIWPTDGVVVALFGNRDGERHDGIDIAAPLGTPVWASRSGKVLYAGEQPGYGLIIIIEHAAGDVTIYAHHRKNLVEKGTSVTQGDPIAEIGESGSATSPALHFEIRVGQKPVNPLSRLPDE